MAKLERLPHDAAIDDVMRVMRRDGAVILTSMMSGAQISALTDELMPYVDATKPGRETFSGFKTTRTGALAARSSARSPGDPRSPDSCDLRSGAAAQLRSLPGQRHAHHPHHARRGCAGDAPRSLVVGLSEGDRTAAQHDLGAVRLHARERGDAGRARVVDMAGQPSAPAGRNCLRGNGARLGAGVHGFGIPRRWREPIGRAAHRHESDLLPELAAAGGEPVSVLSARNRPHARTGAAGPDGIRLGRLRTRLLHAASGQKRVPKFIRSNTRCVAIESSRLCPSLRDRFDFLDGQQKFARGPVLVEMQRPNSCRESAPSPVNARAATRWPPVLATHRDASRFRSSAVDAGCPAPGSASGKNGRNAMPLAAHKSTIVS